MKRSSRTSARQRFRLSVTVVAMALLAVTLAVPAAGGQGKRNGLAPDLDGCQDLAVQAGNKAFFRVYAEGVQIYRWNGTSWVFVAPEADLFANPGGTGLVGVHYAGPTWESVSGSKVIGAVRATLHPESRRHSMAVASCRIQRRPRAFRPGDLYPAREHLGGHRSRPKPALPSAMIARVPYTTEYYFYRDHP